jgi:hypothetical protein
MEEDVEAHHERVMAIMIACLEEIESETAHQEIPKEEAAVETVGTLEDR